MNQPILNFKQIGQGEHVILIHGLFGSLENLNMVAKVLAEHYTVTSIDVRNHGYSFHKNDMSYTVLAQDVIKLLDHLSINQCHFIGHSMGGKIVMQLAISAGERCKNIIIADVAPVPYPAHHSQIIAGLQSIDLSSVTKRSDADKQLSHYVKDQGVRQFLLKNLIKIEDNYHFKCNLDFIEQCYNQISLGISITDNKDKPFLGKALFIKGGNSNYILAEHRPAIAQILPNSRAKIIQGAGHWLHAEKTVAFNKIVLDFLLT